MRWTGSSRDYRASCRSELAREKPENDAGSQACRIIVDDHREQARSYSKEAVTTGINVA
ncbi:hypothetical protein PS850_05798 [Pseudomonas fluorescens]|nr:hypothetical protein PS850_05798 [Pseudomonas fluorescens]